MIQESESSIPIKDVQ